MRAGMKLVIEGRVQGVGYRWWASGEARQLGLTGWVRNRRDGAVELTAFGRPAALDALASACAQGPHGASVSRVVRSEAPDDGSRGFEQRPTQ
jgi:acylphosphatase